MVKEKEKKKQKLSILVDLGNSHTRVYYAVGEGGYKAIDLDNRYAQLPSGYTVPKAYLHEHSCVFYAGNSWWCVGSLAHAEFNRQLIKPYIGGLKATAQTTPITLVYVLLTIAQELEKERLDYDITLHVLLPATQALEGEPILQELVDNLTLLRVLSPIAKEIPLGDIKIKTYPEGVLAFIGARFEVGQEIQVKENVTPFTKGYTLIVDIGEGTTDLALLKEGLVIERSKDTMKLGCRNVEATVHRLAAKKLGFKPENILQIVKTGLAWEGATPRDVTKEIALARQTFAAEMKTEVQNYLETLAVDVRNLKGLLIVGGGAIGTTDTEGKETVPAPSEYLKKYLKELAPELLLVPLNGFDPRRINLEGLKALVTLNKK